MRSVPFRTILEDTLGTAGYPYDEASQTQLDMAARFINRHVRKGWEWGPWPEWTRAEYRPFADNYYATVQYGVGAVVWYDAESKYYQASAITQGNLPTDTNYWAEYTLENHYIAFRQYYQNVINRVWGVYKYNPYTKLPVQQYTYAAKLSTDGIFVQNCSASKVWVLFSDIPSTYSAKVFDPSANYSEGDIVYYPGTEDEDLLPARGECFKAIIDSSGSYTWQAIPFPAALQDYVVLKAAADMLRYYGNKELALSYDSQAKTQLLDEWDKVNPLAYQNVGINT